jgi:hypothetical protein
MQESIEMLVKVRMDLLRIEHIMPKTNKKQLLFQLVKEIKHLLCPQMQELFQYD